MRLIDADALVKELTQAKDECYKNDIEIARGIAQDIIEVEISPTIDAVPVIHAHWILTEYEFFYCSNCGKSYYTGCESTKEAEEKLAANETYHYCPYCGAIMDEESSSNLDKAFKHYEQLKLF